jgi:hypothetical protein
MRAFSRFSQITKVIRMFINFTRKLIVSSLLGDVTLNVYQEVKQTTLGDCVSYSVEAYQNNEMFTESSHAKFFDALGALHRFTCAEYAQSVYAVDDEDETRFASAS